MFFAKIKQNRVNKSLDVWQCLAVGATVAQAHAVNGKRGIVEGGAENYTLGFSLLSEYVYMCKTLHCFLTEEIQSFYYLWADSSGIVLKSLLFLIQLKAFYFLFNCNELSMF